MSLSPLFPHYGSLGTGPYYVSLAIPGLPSKISKSVGLTSSSGLLLPNIDFIKKFTEGDLGISDSFYKDMIMKNMNSKLASNNEEIFKQFAKLNKIDVTNIEKFKKGNKFVIPKDQIKIPKELDMTGFKAFEKTALQSIFETQKPYMEIVKTVIETVAKTEDIIARVMPFFGNPLTTKSKVPTKNAGSGKSKPKAIGYQGAKETKELLKQLESIRQMGIKSKVITNKGLTSSNPNDVSFIPTTETDNTSGFINSHWNIISTVYSTGLFNPNLDYDYKYIDLPADELTPDTPITDIDLSNGDPYENFKPKSLIFGIYNSKGEAIDPSEYLKTIGMNGNNKTEVDTPFKRADWLLRSPKWKVTEGYEWPSFGEPNYVWVNRFGRTITSDKKPNNQYSIKKYRSGQKDILTGEIAIEGNPIIESFNKKEETEHRKEFIDIINIGLHSDTDTTKEEKLQINNDIMGKIDMNSQLEIAYLYAHSMSSVYKKVNSKEAFPDLMKKSYKPYEIYSPEAAKDPILSAYATSKGKKPGMIWIEPEADYDMKVIRVDPISKIEYNGAQGGPELETSITKFVKNRVRFDMSNGSTFSFSISKNGTTPDIVEDVQEFTFENWNFENPKLVNTNTFNVSMWSKTPPRKFTDGRNNYSFRVDRPTFTINDYLKTLGVTQSTPTITQQYTKIPTYDTSSITKSGDNWRFSTTGSNYLKDGINTLGDGTIIYTENNIIKRWYYLYNTKLTGPGLGFNLPAFGIERKITYNFDNSKFDIIDKTIPLYRLKIDQKYSSSKIIDPSQVTNNKLTTSDLFTKDPFWYGHGSVEDPQTLGIIKRYALTDLDTESYYIVEGVLSKENEFQEDESGRRKNSGKGSGGGKSWYKIRDAIGAIRVFVNLLVSIMTKLIPKIKKLLALFKNPSQFVIDIIAEKLGDNVDFLTKESLSTFQSAIKLRDQIKSQVGNMDNISQKIDKIRLEAKDRAASIVSTSDNENIIEAKRIARKVQDEAEKQATKLENTLNKKKELVNKLKDKFKKSSLSNYVHVDDSLDFIFTLGGAATIPFSLFGKDLSFGAALEMNNIPKKPPIKLIFPSMANLPFKNVQFLISKTSKPNAPVVSTTLADLVKQETLNIQSPVKSLLNETDKSLPYNTITNTNDNQSDTVQVKFEDGTVKYIPSSSVQDFVNTNQSKYDFIYVTENVDRILKDVDKLILSGTNEDLVIAKEMLDHAKSKDSVNNIKGANSAIDDKIKKLESIASNLLKNTQPLLKILLGFITFPIKVVADIIKWLMDFFMSLTNPMKLASKMKEFLSFEWILQFFTPTGILSIFGLKFQPLVLIPYTAMATAATGKIGGKIAAGKADMSKYINLGFIPTLPTYSADQYKNLLKGLQPIRFLTIFKMMEKFINGIIDFIWSLFGIEALIPAPHINMSSMYNSNDTLNPVDIQKAVDNTTPKGNTEHLVSDGLNTISNTGTQLNPVIQSFVYEIKLPDGTIKTYLNRDDLDKFVEDNKDIEFDFNFD